ncbi:MAG: transporter substrate-binding domain-containing protein [Desulfobacteraceae bacterium]|jgi:membrane-bound lytic murein transglycosylase MltF
MSKLKFFLIVFFILFSLKAGSTEQKSPLEHPLDSHLTEVIKDDLPVMLERQYIRVLTTINNTNFFLDGVNPHGFEYSLLKQYEEQLNKGKGRRKLKTVLQFIPVPRDRLFDDLANGYGDIAAAGLTITRGRMQHVDFTDPYLSDISEIVVTHKDAPAVNDRDDLSGKEVFLRKSSSYYESIIKINNVFKLKKMEPIKIIEADENLETEDILEMINTGAINMTVCDSHIAEIWSKVLPDIRLYKDITFRKGGKIAWAVRKDNPLLKESLNSFIKDHKKGTLMGNIFFTRYYEKMKWLKNPLKRNFEQRAAEYKPLIQKYSKQYGFDWKLILSMAFQESGLNHNKKSNRGAVGLMQIKPSTAADPKVGIKNVTDVENNIHAAVKYLDFIRSRYYSDDKIRPRDRVRFSLAAYNAGPAKINSARRKAKTMGLDPDKWFRNVELAVLKTVSQEPVKYVSNINKYYIIYKYNLDIKENKELAKEEI